MNVSVFRALCNAHFDFFVKGTNEDFQGFRMKTGVGSCPYKIRKILGLTYFLRILLGWSLEK